MDEIMLESTSHDYIDVDSDTIPMQQNLMKPTEYRGDTNQNTDLPTDYRGTSNTTLNNPLIKTNQNEAQTKQTYAAATDITFPKPEQAIIIEAVDNTPLREFQVAVGKLVENKNITFASRMSRNRICIYLKTEELANNFVANNTSLTLNNNKLHVRKLKSAAKRITFSEVPPHINNNNLLQQLQKNNLEILSPINLLKSNMRDPEFSHVFSFRRQAIVKTRDNTEIPHTILIEVDEEIHRIFLSNDDIRCSKCKGKGHIAEKCRKLDDELPTTQTTITLNTTTETRKRLASEPLNSPSASDTENNISNETIEVRVTETVIPGSQPSITVEPIKLTQRRATTSTRRKKTKIAIPIENLLEPLKKIIRKHPKKYPIDYENLKKFISETKTIQKTPQELKKLARKYVEETDQLSEMLQNLYPELKHRSIKARFSTVQKILNSNTDNGSGSIENLNITDTQTATESESEVENWQHLTDPLK